MVEKIQHIDYFFAMLVLKVQLHKSMSCQRLGTTNVSLKT